MGRRCIVLIDGLDSRNDNDRFNKEFERSDHQMFNGVGWGILKLGKRD